MNLKIMIKKPTESEAALFEQWVTMVQLSKKVGQASSLSAPQSQATFLEELIDACVLELYFPEEASAKDLRFMDQVSALLNVPQASRLPTSAEQGRRDACDTISPDIKSFVATAPSHPIRNQLLRLTAECESAHAPSNFFAVIKQEGTV